MSREGGCKARLVMSSLPSPLILLSSSNRQATRRTEAGERVCPPPRPPPRSPHEWSPKWCQVNTACKRGFALADSFLVRPPRARAPTN
eukprot:scaffold248419_cov28-Tisochrysis_lutea.AAC.1